MFRAGLVFLTLHLLSSLGVANTVDPDFSNPFGEYGTVQNFFCPLDGICAADEVMNSFVFLDTHYPSTYPGNKLVPGNDPNRDALWFAGTPGLDGWDGPNGHRSGYYTRAKACSDATCFDQVLLQTKQDWVTDWAPGSTRFDSMIASAGKGFPSIAFLMNELQNHEDVELIIDIPGDGAHALGLTDISCDATGNNCTVRYQDPNDPTHQSPSVALFTFPETGELGIPYGAGNVAIRSALAESPVPEPATSLPVAISCTGFLVYCYRRRRRGQPTQEGIH